MASLEGLQAAVERLAASQRAMVTRAKVVQSGVGSRVIVQVTALNNEEYTVELLHSALISTRPKPGADVVLLQVLGTRDHLVAFAGDSVGEAIADLAEGEGGMAAFGARIVFRADRLEVTSATLPIEVTAGNGLTATVTGGLTATVTGDVVVNSTTHIELNAPGDNVTVNGRLVQLI